MLCHHHYFYWVDEDFGPLFIQFACSFPSTARVGINGHEYAKRPLAKEGIAFDALDNGVLCCADPLRLRQILDELNVLPIQALVNKWLARRPDPFSAQDPAAGFNPPLSILQAECCRTQVQAFDRPLSGRHVFEPILRENLDRGRPSKVSLTLQRRITQCTPGTSHSRVMTQGVIPSRHIRYKSTPIKPYFKEERAVRTETPIHNSHDFGIGRLLKNLPDLRDIGLAAHRRLLEVETLSQDCVLAEGVFDQLSKAQVIKAQRVPAPHFDDGRVMALWQVLCRFRVLPEGFRTPPCAKGWRRHWGSAPSGTSAGV